MQTNRLRTFELRPLNELTFAMSHDSHAVSDSVSEECLLDLRWKSRRYAYVTVYMIGLVIISYLIGFSRLFYAAISDVPVFVP